MTHAVMLAVLLAAGQPASTAIDGYWKMATPTRTPSAICQLVTSQAQLENGLRAIGWDMSQVPVVEWSRSRAVIVAPSRRRPGRGLALWGLDVRDGTSSVRWGWKLPETSVTTSVDIKIGAGESLEAFVVAFSSAGSQTATCPESAN